MKDLIDRLRMHDDERLYIEAGAVDSGITQR